jgi:hypothetical protein
MGKRTDTDWQPTPGDTLMGTLTDAMLVNGTRYGDTPLAVVTDKDTGTKHGVWLSRSMLLRLFNETRPAPGSKLVIRYDGTAVSPSSGRTFHTYRMRVETGMPLVSLEWIDDIVAELKQRKAKR